MDIHDRSKSTGDGDPVSRARLNTTAIAVSYELVPARGRRAAGRTRAQKRCKGDLQILALASKRGKSMVVEDIIHVLLGRRDPLNAEAVSQLTGHGAPLISSNPPFSKWESIRPSNVPRHLMP